MSTEPGDESVVSAPPPRLHVLPAAGAPDAVVLRRGPSDWWHVLRWRLDILEVRARRLVQRPALPAPLRRLARRAAARVLRLDARRAAVGRLLRRVPGPWLRALAAWRVGSTWASGCEFHRDGTFAIDIDPATPPDHGSFPGRRGRRTPFETDRADGLRRAGRVAELRNGWRLRPAGEPDTALTIERDQPSPPGATLRAIHEGHDFDEHAIEGALLRYELDGAPIDGVVWADWDATGRLLARHGFGADRGAGAPGRRRPRDHVVTRSDGLEPAPATCAAVGRTLVAHSLSADQTSRSTSAFSSRGTQRNETWPSFAS